MAAIMVLTRASADMQRTVPNRPIPCRAVHGLTLAATLVAISAALGNWWSRISGNDMLELITKPAVTIAIAVIGVSVADGAPTGAVVAAVIAFVLCLAGDVALLPAIDRFVIGLAAFLLGHVAFVVMFIALGTPEWGLAAIAAGGTAALAAVVGRRVIAGAATSDAALVMPVRAYLVVISAMAIVGWATGIPAAIVGSSLFLLSDSVLGWRQFVGQRRWMSLATMVTYHGALLGLALSLGS
jgi:uncharacterized membrane protein YhhN